MCFFQPCMQWRSCESIALRQSSSPFGSPDSLRSIYQQLLPTIPTLFRHRRAGKTRDKLFFAIGSQSSIARRQVAFIVWQACRSPRLTPLRQGRPAGLLTSRLADWLAGWTLREAELRQDLSSYYIVVCKLLIL